MAMEPERWRICRSNPHAMHIQQGTEPSTDDPLVGFMSTPALAVRVVDAINTSEKESR